MRFWDFWGCIKSGQRLGNGPKTNIFWEAFPVVFIDFGDEIAEICRGEIFGFFENWTKAHNALVTDPKRTSFWEAFLRVFIDF